jgi:hypothetical protein
MKATVISKAIGLGVFTELAASAMSVVLFCIGSWGLCGPAVYWAVAAMLIQFPGWYLEEDVLEWGMHPGIPGATWGLPVTFALQASLWTVVWLLWLAWRVRRPDNTEPSAPPNGGPAAPSGNSGVSGGRHR